MLFLTPRQTENNGCKNIDFISVVFCERGGCWALCRIVYYFVEFLLDFVGTLQHYTSQALSDETAELR